jgi:hypothetical protein
MWKKITKDQIKDYPAGTKVRINGQETCIEKHEGGCSCGFHTADAVYHAGVWDSKYFMFSHRDWGRGYTVEVWEEDPLTSLEDVYVDTENLDSDTCKRLVEAFVSQGYEDSTQGYWGRGIDGCYCLQIDAVDDDLCYFSGSYGHREVTPKQVFDFVAKGSQKVPEDNNVEKLNDLINKYFAQNTTLSLAEFLDGRGVKV